MLLKDIPLDRQLALLNVEDKNDIGSLIFGDLYDQDCVDKIWSEIKEPPYLHILRDWIANDRYLNEISFWINKEDPLSWQDGHPFGKVEIIEPILTPHFYKSLINSIHIWVDKEKDYLENQAFGWEKPSCEISRWCCSPYLKEFYISKPFVYIKSSAVSRHIPPIASLEGISTYYNLDGGRHGQMLSSEHKIGMLSDYQYMSDREFLRTPGAWINENNNQANLDKVRQSVGQDPRRRYLREQYHIISENYATLSSMWGILDEEELMEKVRDWNVKANLWIMGKDKNGKTTFSKKQSDIKFYKDYIKVQLGLLITPFKNESDRVQYDKTTFLGQRGYEQVWSMGFRKSRWRKLGIGEVEGYNCSLLNYVGREPIFQKDNQNLLFVKDGQYLITNLK
tara:strand:+ start:1490 stop:2674 length:1185 start_codon:yes stop_codon:yes gene_type:complete